MWKKNDDFSKEDLSRLLNTPQAMALAAMLQKMDPNQLARAAEAAQAGDAQRAKQLLSPLMQDPKAADLLKQLEEKHGGI